jgi:predicted HAD superfamily Cof-like phosphohydrolase
MSIFKDQADFMTAGGQTVIAGNGEQIILYAGLIEEESVEFFQADAFIDEPNFVSAESIKEAYDTIVVAAGYLISALGVGGAQAGWNLVHESNLSKVSGVVEKRADGKILKNEEYKKVRKAKLMADLTVLLQVAEKN